MEYVVPIHPALEELWRLFEPYTPTSKGARIDIVRRPAWGPRETRRQRRLHGYLSRLRCSQRACRHADIVRVMWADWTVTPLCRACGCQGHPMRAPAIGDTLVIPRDLEEFLAVARLRLLAPSLTFR